MAFQIKHCHFKSVILGLIDAVFRVFRLNRECDFYNLVAVTVTATKPQVMSLLKLVNLCFVTVLSQSDGPIRPHPHESDPGGVIMYRGVA